jgi:multiple sugar transport system substrate-binding protein
MAPSTFGKRDSGMFANAAPLGGLGGTPFSRRGILKASGLVAGATAATPLLSACGRGSSGGSTGSSYNMWVMSDTVPIMKHFAAKYREGVNSKFKVNITEIPSGMSLRAKIISASAAGQLPELLDVSMNYGSDFATYNLFEPLDKLISSDVASKYSLYSRVWDWADTANIPGYEGEQHVFGLPYGVSVFVPAYRADFFREAGVEFPKNWEELVTVGQALTQAPKRYALSVPTSGDLMDEFHPFLMQAGARYVNDDLTEAFPNREQAYEGFQFYKDLSSEHRIAPAQAPDRFAGDPVQRLSSGQVAVTTLSVLSVNAMREEATGLEFGPDKDWYVSKFWEGSGGPGGYYNANCMHIRKGVKNVQGAVEFMEWMLEPEQQLEMYRSFNRPPINTQVWDQDLADDKEFAIYRESIDLSERQGGFRGWKLAEFTIDRGVERVVIDGEDVQSVVDSTATDMLQAIQNA